MTAGQREGAFYPELKASAINYKWLTKKDEIELNATFYFSVGDSLRLVGAND